MQAPPSLQQTPQARRHMPLALLLLWGLSVWGGTGLSLQANNSADISNIVSQVERLAHWLQSKAPACSKRNADCDSFADNEPDNSPTLTSSSQCSLFCEQRLNPVAIAALAPPPRTPYPSQSPRAPPLV